MVYALVPGSGCWLVCIRRKGKVTGLGITPPGVWLWRQTPRFYTPAYSCWTWGKLLHIAKLLFSLQKNRDDIISTSWLLIRVNCIVPESTTIFGIMRTWWVFFLTYRFWLCRKSLWLLVKMIRIPLQLWASAVGVSQVIGYEGSSPDIYEWLSLQSWGQASRSILSTVVC